MKIFITPEDIVERCLWDAFSYYIVGSEKDSREILKENKEFEINERDALVIGLLKIIKTDNLIHKFNDYVNEFLVNKSTREKNMFLVRKNLFDNYIDKFFNKFPSYWMPRNNYVEAYNELVEYVDRFKEKLEKLEKLEIKTIDYEEYTNEFYYSNRVRKLLEFNY